MKATELRIGNWVRFIDKKVQFQIGCISHNEIEMGFVLLSEVEPIPLTEEWLLKFGFKSNPYNDTYYLENIYFEGCKLVFECNKTRGFTELWSDKFPLVENVHQLQNLYFALTGEELPQVSEGKNKNFV